VSKEVWTSNVQVDYMATYDHEARATYVYLPNHPRGALCVARTSDVGHGLHLDFDSAGNLIGIEHLWGAVQPETGEETR
jgi:uncharacterized protein YuzE